MNFNWYDLFVCFSYGSGDVHGVIYFLNPLYVVLLIFLPAILVSFKNRVTLPKFMGIEMWQIGLISASLLFVLGIIWHFLIQK